MIMNWPRKFTMPIKMIQHQGIYWPHIERLLINVEQDDQQIMSNSKISYKQFIKNKVRMASFKYLRERQQTHSKVKNINYSQLTTQKYMVSPIFSNKEVNMLYALRSRATECRANYKQKYIHSNILYSIFCDVL